MINAHTQELSHEDKQMDLQHTTLNEISETQRVLTDGNLTKQTSIQNRSQEKLGSMGEEKTAVGRLGWSTPRVPVWN